MPSNHTADLLTRARQRDPDALNVVFERMSPRLLAFVRLRMGRELRARFESRDILQAALVKAFQKIDQFRGSETRSLAAWLAKIAEHEIRDAVDHVHRHRRDASREDTLDDAGSLAAMTRSALTRVILDEEARRLEAAIDRLSPEHGDVILMRKFQELSFAEIAERTGRSADACRMLLARAMTALTMALSESRG